MNSDDNHPLKTLLAEITFEFAAWAMAAYERAPSDVERRAFALTGLLDIKSRRLRPFIDRVVFPAPRLHLINTLLRQALDGQEPFAGSDNAYAGPLPAQLRKKIEYATTLVNRAASHQIPTAEQVFVLPAWLALNAPQPRQVLLPAVRVHLGVDGRPQAVKGGWKRKTLAFAPLMPRIAQIQRPAHIHDEALLIQSLLKLVLGWPPTHSAWLEENLNNPESAERRGLKVWADFLTTLSLPRGASLLPPTELSLATLHILSGGPEDGRRYWFADEWPSVAYALLRTGKAHTAFRRLDKSPPYAREKVNAAVEITSAYFCCSGKADCEKAGVVAKILPKYKNVPDLTRLLGDDPELVENEQIRQILVEANFDESGGLLRRIAQCPSSARAYFECAVEVAYQPEFTTSDTRLGVATLVARMLLGRGLDPMDILAPRRLAEGLCAVSADCLAASVATYRENSPPRPEEEDDCTDTLEIGMRAFINFLARLTPLLTPQQLARFTAFAARNCVHQVENVASQVEVTDLTWPAPTGWTASDRVHRGTQLTPLLSARALREEGNAMGNCLKDGRYDGVAAFGDLALFSIKAVQSRATLSVKEVRQQARSVDRYEINQVLGPHNEPVSTECRQAAESLVKRLNGRLPAVLSTEEGERRRALRKKINDRRTFNQDMNVATERWERIYAPQLPKRARTAVPIIVGDFFD